MKETAYLIQAALIAAWWVGLASSPSFFGAFQFEGISATAFWSFFLPDIILIGVLSAIRAYRESTLLEYVVLGAFGYATLYCFNATLLTGSGYLPTGFMLIGFAYNIFLCFNQSLFRTSATPSVAANGIKTLAQIVCIWVLALAVIPFVILDSFDSWRMPNIGIPFIAGCVIFFCFSLLGLSSAWFMVRDGEGTPLPLDQTNRLVVSGPYHWVRNPMAIAGVGQGAAIAFIFQSAPVLIYALMGALIWHCVVRPIEERDMENRFGETYLNYRKQVTCWFPTFNKKQ